VIFTGPGEAPEFVGDITMKASTAAAGFLVLVLSGCGGTGGGEPVGLYAGHWRGTWDGTFESDIIDLRISRNGEVSGTFERGFSASDGDISGTLEPDGDLDADYDSTEEDGTLDGKLRFDENINKLKGTLTRHEGEVWEDIVVHVTRR
jgi:hypothetical protein